MCVFAPSGAFLAALSSSRSLVVRQLVSWLVRPSVGGLYEKGTLRVLNGNLKITYLCYRSDSSAHLLHDTLMYDGELLLIQVDALESL